MGIPPNIFPIDTNIPDGPNDPADDQPIMKQNNANTVGWMSVDHITPGSFGNGWHQKVTFKNIPIPIPGSGVPNPLNIITDPASVEYTNVGIADPSKVQLYWRNQTFISPLSATKAFCSFSSLTGIIPPGGVVTTINSFNVDSIIATSPSGGLITYTINFTPGAIFGLNVVPIISPNVSSVLVGATRFNTVYFSSYTLNTLTIIAAFVGTSYNLNILMLQS